MSDTQLSWILPSLAIGARPTSPQDWARLARDVTCIIDLNDDHAEHRKAEKRGLKYLGLEVEDPTSTQAFLDAFPVVSEWIDEECMGGGRTFLHCTAGLSRSPTIAMAYLMTLGETKDSAKQLVLKAHQSSWTAGDLETLERSLELWKHQLLGEVSALKLSRCTLCERPIDTPTPYVRKVIVEVSDVLLGPVCSKCSARELSPVRAIALSPSEYYRTKRLKVNGSETSKPEAHAP